MNEEYKVLFVAGAYQLDNRLHICYTAGKGNKFTLAYFEKTKEGYDLKFVGGRPFEYSCDGYTYFMDFAKACFKYTEALEAFEEILK